MSQTVLGGSSVAAHRQDHRNSCLHAEAVRSSFDRAAHDPLVAQKQLPTIQKLPKTVEIPQAQFMPPCHTEILDIRPCRRLWSSHKSSTPRVSSTETSTCPLLCETMSPWSRQRRTPLKSNRPKTLTGSQVSAMLQRQV